MDPPFFIFFMKTIDGGVGVVVVTIPPLVVWVVWGKEGVEEEECGTNKREEWIGVRGG